MLVALAGCMPNNRKAGESCGGDDGWCDQGLTCHEKRCITIDAWKAIEVEKLAIKEAQQIKQAGGKAPAAETQPPATGPAPRGAVRVVELKDKGFAVAACRADERLIGGGCEGLELVADRPDRYSQVDTAGSTWRCKSSRPENPVTAFALCARIAPP